MKFKTTVATLLASSASTNAINIEQFLPTIKNIPRALQEYYWYYFDEDVQTMDAHGNGTGIDPDGECVCMDQTEFELTSEEGRRGELLDAIRVEMLESDGLTDEELAGLLNQFVDICGQGGMGMTLLADIEFSQCGGESSTFNYVNYPACVSRMCGGTDGDIKITSEVIAMQVNPFEDCDNMTVSNYSFFNETERPKESCQIVIPLEPEPSEDDQVMVDDEVKEIVDNVTNVENVTGAPSSYYETDDEEENNDDEFELPPGVSMECQQDFAQVFPEFYTVSSTLVTLQVTNLVGPVDYEFIFEKEKHEEELDLFTSNCTDSLGTTFYASWMYGEACLDDALNSMKYTHVPVCLPTSCGYHASKVLMEIVLLEGDNDLCEVNVSIDESVPMDEDDSSKSAKSSKSSAKEPKSSSKKASKSVKSSKTVKTVKKEKKIKVPKSGISGGRPIDRQCQFEMMGFYGNEMGVDPYLNPNRHYVIDTLMECSDPEDALQFCEYNGNETALEEFSEACESLNGTAVQTDWKLTDICTDINATAMVDSIGMWECIPNVCSETDAMNFFHTIYFHPEEPSCYAEVSYAHMHSGAKMVKSAKGSDGVIASTKITKAGGTSKMKKLKRSKNSSSGKAGGVTSKMSKAEGSTKSSKASVTPTQQTSKMSKAESSGGSKSVKASSTSSSSLPKKMKKVKVVKSSSLGTETVAVPSTMSLETATKKIMKKKPKALR
ncbi:predicted protein [Chaetoceros tenuissimus]|uniref:Uncharacterized protein n=1 Tax=Chaetoceros tenuissimus TaxID=426638 RepID=A0AAD3D256_9STRA|nr:predicted protein [Chaetoceros tenuissimus]